MLPALSIARLLGIKLPVRIASLLKLNPVEAADTFRYSRDIAASCFSGKVPVSFCLLIEAPAEQHYFGSSTCGLVVAIVVVVIAAAAAAAAAVVVVEEVVVVVVVIVVKVVAAAAAVVAVVVLAAAAVFIGPASWC